jgi:hypothetical protein
MHSFFELIEILLIDYFGDEGKAGWDDGKAGWGPSEEGKAGW